MTTPISVPKRAPWVNQVLVVRALLNREVITRFGKYHLGFVWMLLEPLMSVILMGVIIGTIAGRTVPEIPYAFFLLNGKLLLNLFTGPMDSAIGAIGANQGLLVYPNVKPLDTFIARFLYELLTTIFAFGVFAIAAMWLGVEFSFASLDMLAACYLITWLMGCGVGLICGVVVAHYKEAEKVINILQSPLVFISAVLFPVYAMPDKIKEILLWNPLVHTIELSRKALFPYYHADATELFYPFGVAIILLSIGLVLFHGNRNLMSQG